jgi:hypothetical protein
MSESNTIVNWECCVCYENGTQTGQLVLACSHKICLGCYTSVCKQTTESNAAKCPMCRGEIKTRVSASKAQLEELVGLYKAWREKGNSVVESRRIYRALAEECISSQSAYHQKLEEYDVDDKTIISMCEPGGILYTPPAVPPEADAGLRIVAIRVTEEEGQWVEVNRTAPTAPTAPRCTGCRQFATNVHRRQVYSFNGSARGYRTSMRRICNSCYTTLNNYWNERGGPALLTRAP